MIYNAQIPDPEPNFFFFSRILNRINLQARRMISKIQIVKNRTNVSCTNSQTLGRVYQLTRGRYVRFLNKNQYIIFILIICFTKFYLFTLDKSLIFWKLFPTHHIFPLMDFQTFISRVKYVRLLSTHVGIWFKLAFKLKKIWIYPENFTLEINWLNNINQIDEPFNLYKIFRFMQNMK